MGVAFGFVSGSSPVGLVGAVLGAAGVTGLFFVAMLWFLRVWMGVRFDDEGSSVPISTASRVFALVVGVAFASVCIGVILYVAGFVS